MHRPIIIENNYVLLVWLSRVTCRKRGLRNFPFYVFISVSHHVLFMFCRKLAAAALVFGAVPRVSFNPMQSSFQSIYDRSSAEHSELTLQNVVSWKLTTLHCGTKSADGEHGTLCDFNSRPNQSFTMCDFCPRQQKRAENRTAESWGFNISPSIQTSLKNMQCLFMF